MFDVSLIPYLLYIIDDSVSSLKLEIVLTFKYFENNIDSKPLHHESFIMSFMLSIKLINKSSLVYMSTV